MNKKILVVVDYQNDFADPSGSLYVHQGEVIADNIQSHINSGKYDSIVYTMDSHISEEYNVSKEAEMFPPHCEYGTPGWNLFKIEPINKELDSMMKKKRMPKDVQIGNEFVFVKDKFDVWEANPAYKKFVSSFSKDTEFYICGVAMNYCVASNALGYKEIGYENVFIIPSATKGILDDTYEPSIQKMIDNGINFLGWTNG